MNCKDINKILAETSYVKISGTDSEKKCAEYLKSLCEKIGVSAKMESFPIKMYDVQCAKFSIDGKEIPCKAYYGAPNGTVRAKIYHLQCLDDDSIKRCKGKIVITDYLVGYRLYDKLIENGAVGYVTYNGNLAFNDKDIEQKEIRFEIAPDKRIPAVNIHISDAKNIVKSTGKIAEITVEQTSYMSQSYNVVADIKGETDETIVVSAHFDTTPLSVGAYDNMSSCIALLYMAEYFMEYKTRSNIRLLWCGSEERGLLGSLEYCKMHFDELKNTVLNINLDMLGSALGEFVAFSCINEEYASFLKWFLKKVRFGGVVRHAIRSSDSNSFVHFGVPAISFARYAPSGVPPIHTRYDTAEILSAKQLLKDIKVITKFTDFIATAEKLDVSMEISEKIKTDVENYMYRKLNAIGEIDSNDK